MVPSGKMLALLMFLLMKFYFSPSSSFATTLQKITVSGEMGRDK
jgi:hypothetical protein